MPDAVVKPIIKSEPILHSVKPVQKTSTKVSKTSKADKKPTSTAAKQPRTRKKASGALSDVERRNYVEVAAYYIAQRRGFCGGCPIEDWTQAELEVDRMLK